LKNIKEYYKELGRVTYAIASADGEVKPNERYFTHTYIEKYLVMNEGTYDSSGMNNAYYTDFEFASSHVQNTDECIRKFLKYIDQNYEKGDEELIKRSFTLINKVAFDCEKEQGLQSPSNKVSKVLSMYYMDKNKS
jgi:hypothetical protein